jgi:hypothetical protein
MNIFDGEAPGTPWTRLSPHRHRSIASRGEGRGQELRRIYLRSPSCRKGDGWWELWAHLARVHDVVAAPFVTQAAFSPATNIQPLRECACRSRASRSIVPMPRSASAIAAISSSMRSTAGSTRAKPRLKTSTDLLPASALAWGTEGPEPPAGNFAAANNYGQRFRAAEVFRRPNF